MNGTFGQGLDRLKEHVGHGRLKGRLVVDQVYAKYQHENPEFKHPDGGQAYYLREPLFGTINNWMDRFARSLLAEGDGIRGTMRDWAEEMSAEVYKRAPLEFGDLKGSGHPQVFDDGALYYDRPPNVHRLSEEELHIKAELRRLFEPGRYA